MKHIHENWAFLVNSGILWTSVYNVYGSQNEFVERITRAFILRMRSLGQNGPLRRITVFAVARIAQTGYLATIFHILLTPVHSMSGFTLESTLIPKSWTPFLNDWAYLKYT